MTTTIEKYVFDILNGKYIEAKEQIEEKGECLECENCNNKIPYPVGMKFPFKDRIDDVEIEVRLTFMNKNLYFEIVADELMYKNSGGVEYVIYTTRCTSLFKELTVENVKLLIDELYVLLNTHHYDKRTASLFPFKIVCDGKNVMGDKCSVCHDITKIKTCCNHNLCLECFQSIQNNITEDTEEDGVLCPICRGENTHLTI